MYNFIINIIIKKEKLIHILICILIIILPLLKIHSLHANVMDLGLFSNNIYNVINNKTILFSGHIQPLLYIYALFLNYTNISIPEFLVLSQSLAIILTGIIIRKKFSINIYYVYILNVPLSFIVLNDFHIDYLLIPFITLFYISIYEEKILRSLIFTLLISLIKEPFVLISIFCCIYILIYYKNLLNSKTFKLILILILLYSAYFIISVIYLLPYFSYNTNIFNGEAYGWIFNNNINIVDFDIVNKIKYILYLLLFYLFLPIISIKELFIITPILLIQLLSNVRTYYDYTQHYSIAFIIPLLVCYKSAINKININYNKIPTQKIIFLFIILNILFSVSPLSRIFFGNKVWSFSIDAYNISERDKVIKQLIIDSLPDNLNNLVITSQNSLFMSKLAYSKKLLPFPEGISIGNVIFKDNFDTLYDFRSIFKLDKKSEFEIRYSDYVLIDLKRPLFIVGEGCDFIYNKCKNKKIEELFLLKFEELKINYKLIIEYDEFFIYKKI